MQEKLAPTRSEAYPRAPLIFVAAEVRYPFAAELMQDTAVVRLQRIFHEWLPLVEPFQSPISLPVPVSISLGGDDGRLLRFLSRDRRISVSIAPTRLVVETTAYEHYQDFRKKVNQALAGLQEIDAPIPGLARIGLRYLDEIRVQDGVAKASDWEGLINPALLAPLSFEAEGVGPESLQGILHFNIGESRQVLMRYGAVVGTSVGNAPLRRKDASPNGSVPTGPYFLVDIDSFWTATEPVPEFSRETALATCDRLHIATRQLFESVITERLRNIFRRSI